MMNSGNPLVSVIFPVYGVENEVEASLRSLLDQTYGEIEVIVVDDCSPDGSIEVVQALISRPEYQHRRVRIIRHEKNQGISEARNTGVAHARGKYLFFMDSDDMIPPHAISTHVDFAERHSATITDGNIHTSGYHEMFAPYKKCRKVSGSHDVLASYFSTFHISACNKLILRSFLIDSGIEFIRGTLYEDGIWCVEVLSKAPDYVTVPVDTYTYIIRGDSITQSDTREKSLHRLASYKRLLLFVKEKMYALGDDHIRSLTDAWLAKTVVKIKYNVLKMSLTREEKEDFFAWTSREMPKGSPASVFGILNRMGIGALNACLRRPYEAFSTVYHKIRK